MEINRSECVSTYFGVNGSLSQPSLILMEHDGDGVQLLVSQGGEQLVVPHRGHADGEYHQVAVRLRAGGVGVLSSLLKTLAASIM